MNLHKEKCETVLVSMTEGSWITNAFTDKENFKQDLKYNKIINMIISQIFIGIIAQK